MTKQTLPELIRKKAHELDLPRDITEGFLDFCSSYQKALDAQHRSLESISPIFEQFLELVKKQLDHPHHFLPYHKAVCEPIDCYTLGLEFIRPILDMDHSLVKGRENIQEMQKSLAKGENVILLSNHQTEIDPQIISLLTEPFAPGFAKNMIFVAGHRVTTDPLAVPLSLGCNLLCIYSKRHVENPPEKKAEKLQHNSKVMKNLEELLKEGGKCVYVAPSGGRDRPDTDGNIEVAPFDPQSVELFYLISQKAKRPTHFHTLALKTFALLPPPKEILKDIGEARTTEFSPAFLYYGPEIDMEKFSFIEDKKERRAKRAEVIYKQMLEQYEKL